jgi:hypothetical protein
MTGNAYRVTKFFGFSFSGRADAVDAIRDFHSAVGCLFSKGLGRFLSTGAQILRYGRQRSLIQLMDTIRHDGDAIIALLLSWQLIMDGRYQFIDRIGDALAVIGQSLPSGWIFGVEGQRLGCRNHRAGTVNDGFAWNKNIQRDKYQEKLGKAFKNYFTG